MGSETKRRLATFLKAATTNGTREMKRGRWAPDDVPGKVPAVLDIDNRRG